MVCFLFLQNVHDCGSMWSFLRDIGTGSEQAAFIQLRRTDCNLLQILLNSFFDTWGLELIHFGDLPSEFAMISPIPLGPLSMALATNNELFSALILAGNVLALLPKTQ